MTGNRCPKCARPRNPDGSAGPGCDCSERAGAALRAEREAEIAAAEDFDPLRIRPYVTLESLQADPPPAAGAQGMGDGPAPGAPVTGAEGYAPTADGAPRPAQPAGAPDGYGAGPVAGHGPGAETVAPPPTAHPGGRGPHADAGTAAGAVSGSGTDARPAAGAAAGAHGHDRAGAGAVPGAGHPDGASRRADDDTAVLRVVGPGPMPEAVGDTTEPLDLYVAGSAAQPPPRRRRALAGIVVGAAAVAVVGTAAFAGGLFSGDDERDRALPPDTRSSAPSGSAEPDAPSESVSPSASASASPSASPSVSASPSTSASASATPTPTASPTTASAAPPPPSMPTSTARENGTVSESPRSRPDDVGTLRRGDSGPAVTELQLRLAQVGLFREEDADGRYDGDVEEAVRRFQWWKGQNNPDGVYDPPTRRALEAETREP
ncbi:peptidoglycan-binding protein [Streptomyces peucetius]|uniref:Peptidoglycan-binding protein n=1 Tax=Streptomyces peucetius TaxID=1950 RepID=A0ABY6I7X1_STRPE|nr:peptidoglycan-binding protein [Streptomyces peucetius]UYQ61855.1 peptidoglycan-binding protein [Streptomyces peucetius]